MGVSRGWQAADLAADTSWHQRWTEQELDDLFDWACQVTPGHLVAEPIEAVAEMIGSTPASLSARAATIRQELIDGKGFTLLSGIDVDAKPTQVIAISFLLFSALLGSLRSQNGAGHLLGHVTDVGADINDPTARIYQTNQRQTFHTDSTDAVGLLCLHPALTGGASMIVNVEAVYKRMVNEAPALAARLFEPVATDRRGEQPDGALPWFEIPVLSRTGDRITALYQRQYIDSAARFEAAPQPDARYVEALDLFDSIMNDPTMHFEMSFTPGDIQFVHNHSLLHDRTSFVDHGDRARRRHLLRVWVSLPGDRELPDVFAQRYGSITVGDRGGIIVSGTRPTVSFNP